MFANRAAAPSRAQHRPDAGMGTGLAQGVPVLCEKDMHLCLRPEGDRNGAATGAAQRNLIALRARINGPATASAPDLSGLKAAIVMAHADEPQTVKVFGNLHLDCAKGVCDQIFTLAAELYSIGNLRGL